MIVSEVCKEMFTSSNKSTVKNYEAVGTNGEQASRTDSHNRLRQARLSLVMCGTVALVMQLCPGGTAAVQFSGPILGGFAPELRNVIALLCNMVALPGSVLAFFLVDCAGRLKLLLVSALGQAAAAFGLAYVFYQQSLSADQDSTSYHRKMAATTAPFMPRYLDLHHLTCWHLYPWVELNSATH